MPRKKRPKSASGTFLLLLMGILALGGGITTYLLSQPQDLQQQASEDNRVCAQVLTTARNQDTNECATFPTSCIPQGWEQDNSCENSPLIDNNLTCDFDANGELNISDYNILVECVQNSCSNPQLDISGDGQINAIDLNLYQRTCQ